MISRLWEIFLDPFGKHPSKQIPPVGNSSSTATMRLGQQPADWLEFQGRSIRSASHCSEQMLKYQL